MDLTAEERERGIQSHEPAVTVTLAYHQDTRYSFAAERIFFECLHKPKWEFWTKISREKKTSSLVIREGHQRGMALQPNRRRAQEKYSLCW